MKDLDHYLTLFESADNVGIELIIRAIYAGRYGNADHPNNNILRQIDLELRSPVKQELPEVLDGDLAIQAAKEMSSWRDFLKEDPIPPWALRLGIQAAELTQSDLAERVGVSPRQVRRWLAGDQPCSGSSAVAARMILS